MPSVMVHLWNVDGEVPVSWAWETISAMILMMLISQPFIEIFLNRCVSYCLNSKAQHLLCA